MVEAFFDQASGIEQRLGERRGAAGTDQHFEYGVEGGEVRAARLDDRLDVVAMGSEEL